MIESFKWSDYGLTGPLTLFLGDYTIRAFGCGQTLDYLMSFMERIRQKDESVRWILIDFWGKGKSTLMYNFCSKVNRELFFESDSSPTLALYVDYPRRPPDLLDYTYENGLPLPWTPDKRKDELYEVRQDLFARALRVLAFAWFKKALCDEGYGSSEKTALLARMGNLQEIIQYTGMKMIGYFDSLQEVEIYDSISEILNSFLEYLPGTKELEGEEPLSSRTMRYFPNLLHPESSITFLESFSQLFSEPLVGLRNFVEFHQVCELVDVHLAVVIDEAEDWDYMARTGLDDFLIDILPTNRLSVTLVLRTEVAHRLRSIQKRFRYYLVQSYMKRIRLRDPSSSEILDIAKGILSTCRTDRSLKLFPFTEDFVLALSDLTVRGGHFNLRMFLRSLNRILKLSLAWERDGAGIGAELIERSDLLDAVVEDLKIEEKRELESSVIAKVEEIQKKMQAAREVSKHLLAGHVDPPTRYMLEIVKWIVCEKFQISTLDDMEIIAYTRRKDRTKVNQVIRELREVRTPSAQVIQNLRWDFLSRINNKPDG